MTRGICGIDSAVPSGLAFTVFNPPGAETPGYYRRSLLDDDEVFAQTTQSVEGAIARTGFHGPITACSRANRRVAVPCGMVTVIVSGAVPFSVMVTPGLEAAVSAPIVKTAGHVTRSVPVSTVRVTSGVSDSSTRKKVKTM